MMPVPTYDRFIEPVLRYLAGKPQGALAREVHEAAANALGLSGADRQELLPSGTMPVYKNRCGWAHDRLKRAGLSRSVRRGLWQLTPQGIEFAATHPFPLPDDEVARLAEDFMDVRLRPQREDTAPASTGAERPSASASASPDDRLAEAMVQLRASVSRELLEALKESSPSFFETIVLDLLHKMGYGTSRQDLQRVGGSGDGASMV